jgi:hypothetical protein
MAFSRASVPSAPDAAVLAAAMAGIGMAFATPPARDPNIEDTLLFASVAAMDQDDLRVLAVLVSWFGIHAPWVNADRIARLVAAHASARVRRLWSALARSRPADRRFHRMILPRGEAPLDLIGPGSRFLHRRHGEDPRFAGSDLLVPANVLRDRAADVVSPAALAARHRPYRCRVLIGPSYRADMWAALERDPALTAAELARRAYGSFATAWRVKRDFDILQDRRGVPARRSGSPLATPDVKERGGARPRRIPAPGRR